MNSTCNLQNRFIPKIRDVSVSLLTFLLPLLLMLTHSRVANAIPAVNSISVSNAIMLPGKPITVTVRINFSQDCTVYLSSNNSQGVFNPNSVFIPTGSLSGTTSFTVPSNTVDSIVRIRAFTFGLNGTINGSVSIDVRISHKVPALSPGTPTNAANQPVVPFSCQKLAGYINACTGNAHCTIHDPVATRGYPLICNIHLDSHTLEMTRAMMSATFTYDIHIGRMTVYDLLARPTSHWSLVDGDGTQLDFGLDNSPPAPTTGIFCQLIQTGSGFSVVNAGPPESINSAGNFNYTFDTQGRLLSIVDPARNLQTLAYDASHRLTKVTDANTTKSIVFNYANASSPNISSIVENGGTTRTLTYADGGLSGISVSNSPSPSYSVSIVNNPAGPNFSSITQDGDQNSTMYFSYETRQYSATTPFQTLANEYDAASSTNINWDSSPTTPGAVQRVVISNAKGGTTVHDLDERGNTLTGTLGTPFTGAPQSPVFTTQYDGNDLPIVSSDGVTSTSAVYTGNGQISSSTNIQNNSTSLTYNGVDLTSSQDPMQALLGVFNRILYGDSSQPHVPTSMTDTLGNTWTMGHNQFGQLTTATPPAGSPLGVEAITYYETAGSPFLGYPSGITDGNGTTTTFDSYDAMGDLTSVTTNPAPFGIAPTKPRNTTKFVYDASQRLVKVTLPDGKTRQSFYNGRVLSQTIDEANTSIFYYFGSACLNLKGMSGPLGWSLNWAYDLDKQLTDFTDARGNITHYSYGVNGESTGVAYPDLSGSSLLYTTQGQVRRATNSRSQNVDFSYDNLERLQTVSYPTTANPSITYAYNADDTISSVTDATGTHTIAYFSNGWIQSVTHDYSVSGLSALQEMTYTYFPDGLRKSMTWKSGGAVVGTWINSYDASGNLIRVTNSFGEASNYMYDRENKLTRQTNANGTILNIAYNDSRGWVKSLEYKSGSSTTSSYAMTFDAGLNTVGNLTKVVDLGGGTETFGFDALYRLTGETRTGANSLANTFAYDLAGNLTSLNGDTRTYDNANKLTSFPGSSIAYDLDGDITSLSGANVPSGSFVWDENSKLTQQSNGSATVSYGYGASGLRTWSQSGSNAKTFYLYDGPLLIGEITSGATPIPKAVYTWGAHGLVSERLPDANGNLANGRSLWYSFGPHGETRQLTNSAGAVVDTYLYSAFGVPVSAIGTDPNPFRFGGQVGYYTDVQAGSGLILCGMRWYDPAIARWISRDPIGYAGGANLYAYVGLDPNGTQTNQSFQAEEVVDNLASARAHIASSNEIAEIEVESAKTTAYVSYTITTLRSLGTNSLLASAGVRAAAGTSIGVGSFVVCGSVWYQMLQHINREYDAQEKAQEELSASFARLRALLALKCKPNQIHHYASNKSKKWTGKFEDIANSYGLHLDDDWNTEALPHQGRHPDAYHSWVFEQMTKANSQASGDIGKFQNLFDKFVKNPVRTDPKRMYKEFYEK